MATYNNLLTTATPREDNVIILVGTNTQAAPAQYEWTISDPTQFWSDITGGKTVILKTADAQGVSTSYDYTYYLSYVLYVAGVGYDIAYFYTTPEVYTQGDRKLQSIRMAAYTRGSSFIRTNVNTGETRSIVVPDVPDTVNDYQLKSTAGEIAWTTEHKLYKHNIILRCYGSDISSLVTVEFETINNISTSITTLADFVDLLVPDYTYIAGTGNTGGSSYDVIETIHTSGQYPGSFYVNGISKTTLQSISDTVTEL